MYRRRPGPYRNREQFHRHHEWPDRRSLTGKWPPRPWTVLNALSAGVDPERYEMDPVLAGAVVLVWRLSHPPVFEPVKRHLLAHG